MPAAECPLFFAMLPAEVAQVIGHEITPLIDEAVKGQPTFRPEVLGGEDP